MTTWFISRHPGALHWMQSNNIDFDHHLTHLGDEPVQAGDTVIGSLPVNLAAEICKLGAHYWNLSLLLPADARGRELSANELDLYQAKLEAFSITQNPDAPNPALPLPIKKDSPQKERESTQQSSATATHQQTGKLRKASSQQINNWKIELFKCFIFNENDPAKAERDAALLLSKINSLVDDPACISQLETIARQGRHARALSVALKKKINSGARQAELQDWINEQTQNRSGRIARHLQITLEKQNQFRARKSGQTRQNQDFHITLPQTEFVNGQHPQNLRSQKPCQQWDIYLDETGNNFSDEASALKESDKNLGRIIALALPQDHTLPPLAKPVHSVDLPYSKIQDLLKTITQSKAGILGATLKQDLLSHNWMSAVHQLARWALLMLPMEDGKTCSVRIHIEARAPYDNDAQLLALQDTLDNELKNLLPARFRHLHLSLRMMGKDNPYNGYVDAIANCWGSNDEIKRKLLARTGWRGQCLLQTSDLPRVEDIYRSISSGEEISGYNWFELCIASLSEPEHSLLHDMLQQLGKHSQNNPQLWLNYLEETRQRLIRKDFTPASLRVALDWLQTHQGPNQQLPAHLQLELYSLQLATSNHEGATSLQQIEKLLPLITQLTDECPDTACQAVLRIAVRSSHLYEFNTTLPLLDEWLAQPVAVPGLLNHAKLHSSKGQLLAFAGQHQAALDSFELALKSLARLSDPVQRSRDSEQTHIYQAVVMQDMQHPEAAKLTLQLVGQATKRSGTEALTRLARSGSSHRFVHYLLLRLLLTQPGLDNERQAYLSVQGNWQSGNGHPWMLIEAYRAWLLQQEGQNAQASDLLQIAVDDCFAVGQPMLVWMGYCLQALGSSLRLSVKLPADAPVPASHYPIDQLAQLAAASNDAARLHSLQQLLPFNFH